MKVIVLRLIRFYQKYLSLDTGWARALFITDKVCRFTPRCSEYTYHAIVKYGILKGAALGLRRIARCHLFSKGEYDPVK